MAFRRILLHSFFISLLASSCYWTFVGVGVRFVGAVHGAFSTENTDEQSLIGSPTTNINRPQPQHTPLPTTGYEIYISPTPTVAPTVTVTATATETVFVTATATSIPRAVLVQANCPPSLLSLLYPIRALSLISGEAPRSDLPANSSNAFYLCVGIFMGASFMFYLMQDQITARGRVVVDVIRDADTEHTIVSDVQVAKGDQSFPSQDTTVTLVGGDVPAILDLSRTRVTQDPRPVSSENAWSALSRVPVELVAPTAPILPAPVTLLTPSTPSAVVAIMDESALTGMHSVSSTWPSLANAADQPAVPEPTPVDVPRALGPATPATSSISSSVILSQSPPAGIRSLSSAWPSLADADIQPGTSEPRSSRSPVPAPASPAISSVPPTINMIINDSLLTGMQSLSSSWPSLAIPTSNQPATPKPSTTAAAVAPAPSSPSTLSIPVTVPQIMEQSLLDGLDSLSSKWPSMGDAAPQLVARGAPAPISPLSGAAAASAAPVTPNVQLASAPMIMDQASLTGISSISSGWPSAVKAVRKPGAATESLTCGSTSHSESTLSLNYTFGEVREGAGRIGLVIPASVSNDFFPARASTPQAVCGLADAFSRATRASGHSPCHVDPSTVPVEDHTIGNIDRLQAGTKRRRSLSDTPTRPSRRAVICPSPPTSNFEPNASKSGVMRESHGVSATSDIPTSPTTSATLSVTNAFRGSGRSNIMDQSAPSSVSSYCPSLVLSRARSSPMATDTRPPSISRSLSASVPASSSISVGHMIKDAGSYLLLNESAPSGTSSSMTPDSSTARSCSSPVLNTNISLLVRGSLPISLDSSLARSSASAGRAARTIESSNVLNEAASIVVPSSSPSTMLSASSKSTVGMMYSHSLVEKSASRSSIGILPGSSRSNLLDGSLPTLDSSAIPSPWGRSTTSHRASSPFPSQQAAVPVASAERAGRVALAPLENAPRRSLSPVGSGTTSPPKGKHTATLYRDLKGKGRALSSPESSRSLDLTSTGLHSSDLLVRESATPLRLGQVLSPSPEGVPSFRQASSERGSRPIPAPMFVPSTTLGGPEIPLGGLLEVPAMNSRGRARSRRAVAGPSSLRLESQDWSVSLED
ncbi:hypothetical protein DL93DRAFT_2172900 [Clavulina sp. PMI_390]|nr:hypothetical protein DL93DRAFT_2172900 [Clavulina sp. PMI_390]